MTEQDPRNETPEDAEVEAHGLKEVAATGMSAAAMLAAGAGTAAAATPNAQAAGARSAAVDPTQKGVERASDATFKFWKKTDATNKIAKKTDATIKYDRAGTRVNPSATDKV